MDSEALFKAVDKWLEYIVIYPFCGIFKGFLNAILQSGNYISAAFFNLTGEIVTNGICVAVLEWTKMMS